MPKRYLTGGGKDLKNRCKSYSYISKFAKKLKTLSENLKNLYKKRSNSADCCSEKNPFARFFRKKSVGVAILETAMTLPIVLYIVFFSIELIRMGLAQSAVDAITKECTFSLMAKGNVSDFDSIFLKYKPWGIPIGNFRYNIRLYQYMVSLDGRTTTKGIMDRSPYGGDNIYWAGDDWDNISPNASPTQKASSVNYGVGNYSRVLIYDKYQEGTSSGEVGSTTRKSLLNSRVPSGYIFILTVAVVFPFSSPFVKKLFNGGSNTKETTVDGPRADAYILWARGSGMVN